MPSSSPVERWRADRDSPPPSTRSQQRSWPERWMALRRNPAAAAAAFASRGLEAAAGYPLFMIIASLYGTQPRLRHVAFAPALSPSPAALSSPAIFDARFFLFFFFRPRKECRRS
ncbi:hypothetical protein MTO96_006926 [Rhipicephalus appendiculatus]